MALCTGPRGRLVEQYRFALNELAILVASRTWDLLVRAFEWIICAFVVVEERGSPPRLAVAVGAFRILAAHGELFSVAVFMAAMAFVWS